MIMWSMLAVPALPQSKAYHAYQACQAWETLRPPFCFLTASLSSPFFPFDMSQPPIQDLFNDALQSYEKQTGINLVEHPLAKQLETYHSLDSITNLLQEQTRIFHRFRGDDGKLMKLLRSSVEVLYMLSTETVLGENVGLVHSKSFIGVLCS